MPMPMPMLAPIPMAALAANAGEAEAESEIEAAPFAVAVAKGGNAFALPPLRCRPALLPFPIGPSIAAKAMAVESTAFWRTYPPTTTSVSNLCGGPAARGR